MSLLYEAQKAKFKCADQVDSKMVYEWIKAGHVSRRDFLNWLAHHEELAYNRSQFVDQGVNDESFW